MSRGIQRERKGASRTTGTARERQLVKRLGADRWVAFRAPASLGVADVIALRDGDRPRMIEVKATSTRGPWNKFGPAERKRLSDAARQAGADAFVVHWPLRSEPVWIPESAWPA